MSGKFETQTNGFIHHAVVIIYQRRGYFQKGDMKRFGVSDWETDVAILKRAIELPSFVHQCNVL